MQEAKTRLQGIIQKRVLATRGNNFTIKEGYPLTVKLSSTPHNTPRRAGNNDSSLSEPVDSIIEYAYVFNFTENGFAIISAINEFPELITFSYDGNLPDPEKDPLGKVNPMVTDFLHELALYAEVTLRSSVDDDGNNPILYKTYGDRVGEAITEEGLCPVTWHQRSPFNDLFPMHGSEREPTGCVPVAVAQMMACYKYPAQQGENYYDWNRMIRNDSVSLNDSEIRMMKSVLLRQLSLPANLAVHYDTLRGNGSDLWKITRTLRNFGFSIPGTEKPFSENTVIDEVKSGHPVILGGYSPTGHAWLVHGLYEQRRTVTTFWRGGGHTEATEYQYLFLCNWGWADGQNGYYWSSNFKPDKNPEDNVTNPKPVSGVKGCYTNLSMYLKFRP